MTLIISDTVPTLSVLTKLILYSTVRPAPALFLVPGIYSAIEKSANAGSCYLVLCKFLQKIVLFLIKKGASFPINLLFEISPL